MMEAIFQLIEIHEVWFVGFMMSGVLLVLIGVQNVTKKNLKQYIQTKRDHHRIDEIIAWGIFYIIFGVLILGSAAISIYSYIG